MIDPKTNEVVATGRRKTATARVRIVSGSGKMVVNGRPFDTYFPTDALRTIATRPLAATDSASRFDVRINVAGGGPVGQAGAVSLGLARALLESDANAKGVLRAEGLLTRDPRMRERKKYGQPGARKRFQFSTRYSPGTSLSPRRNHHRRGVLVCWPVFLPNSPLMSAPLPVRVAILGASGYSGDELVRLPL